MSKKRIYIIIFIIFVLALLAGNLTYPKYFNWGIDFLNQKFSLRLAHFPEIPFKLGLDLQGGAHLVYQADLSNIEEKEKKEAMEGLRDVIERRVNIFGIKEPVVQIQRERLIVELAGVLDVTQAIEMIGKTPYLEFKEEKENYQEILEKNKKAFESGQGLIEDPFKETPLTGRYLKKAEVNFNQTSVQPLVLLQFNDQGAKIFEELTEKNVGKILAIYLDGLPISTPVVQEKISGGRAQITGNFTLQEAKELARNLNTGALPVPIKLISQQTVGPTLGKDSLEKSLQAGTLGFILILFFMVIFYRLPGFFATLSLIFYLIFTLSIFKLLSVTLTLAGIAGFLLSMGMAVDANILIFSRLREELKLGRSYLEALSLGFQRAWPAIRDGNFTTILVALILFFLGSGFLQGFALTLILGNLIGMFCSIVITNNFLRAISQFKFGKSINWLWK